MIGDFSPEEKDGFYKAVFSRRDVRSHFTPEPIDEQVLTRILNAAHHAPSVGFSQPWNFILVKNTDTRKQVKDSFDKERIRSSALVEDPKRSKYLSLRLQGIMDCAVNICITYDPTKFGPFVIGRSSIPETRIYSVCCAIQNLWLQQEQTELVLAGSASFQMMISKKFLKFQNMLFQLHIFVLDTYQILQTSQI